MHFVLFLFFLMTQQILAESLVHPLESALDELFPRPTNPGERIEVSGDVIIDACHRAVSHLNVPREVVEDALLALSENPRHFNPQSFAQVIFTRLSVGDTVDGLVS